MAEFQKIDLTVWPRREYFEHYFSQIPCTFSMTVKLDVSAIVRSRRKLYPTMLYCISRIVNAHEEFRMAINDRGVLGVYSELVPSYTIFHKDTQTFSNLWTGYSPDEEAFFRAYEQDLKRYGDNHGMIGKFPIPKTAFRFQ